MFKRARSQTASKPQFSHRIDGDELVVELLTNSVPTPVTDWLQVHPSAAGAMAQIEDMATSPESSNAHISAQVLPTELRLNPGAVACLDAASAAAFGLPQATSLALDLKPRGRIDEDSFHLGIAWVRPGGHPVRVRIEGALIHSDAGIRRIPEPLWSMFQAALPLATPVEQAERFEALAKLGERWPECGGLPVEADAYLKDLRIHYASGMSLKLRVLTPERTEFDPVLFSARSRQDANESDRALDENADSILPAAAQKLFAENRFKRETGSRPAYVLRNGEYVFIDPALRPALSAVRELQDAPEKERRDFILNPRRVLRSRLGASVAERIDLDNLFVDTEQFSERVAGVDVWRKPVLPWLMPAGKNTWLPERFGLRIGDDYYSLPAENVPEALQRVDEARRLGTPTAHLSDLLEPVAEGPPPPADIPITEQLSTALNALRPFAPDVSAEPTAEALEGEWDAQAHGKLFLIVRDNFEEVEFAMPAADADVAAPLLEVETPARLRSRLKKHQEEGLSWLASSAASGRSGVLLADDMGLGKTLQAIAFMAWLQDQSRAGNRESAPFLIVAPTGLLGNWRDEIEKHLLDPGLGPVVPAFGSNLKHLRDEDSFNQRDIETGRAALDAAAWRDAGVVLTTYETLRDYHFSFARTRFALTVFDEIQKLKNPASQVTRAAKTLNSEFVLGMTGTPVENRLQDLWSIMDIVSPGLLGSSRDFERRHPPQDRDALATLKHQLTTTTGKKPAYMLRRLKVDVLEGMPKKHVHAVRVSMPPLQAATYRDLVMRAAAARAAGNMGKGGMLSTLASMRGVSLHPVDPRQPVGNLVEYGTESARLSQALSTLEAVAQKREKALIFVEDLAMQQRLASLIQAKFSLPALPMRINGSVPGSRRQQMVREFQAKPDEFDVMILSPKAGGVGLTLTAANHVIHLSRWWNPAVEDQATDRVFRIGQTKDVHVHLPLAVHPDQDLTDSSFDLRLDALMARKRQLTRDLFMPPDADDGDLAELFREVSLDKQSDVEDSSTTSSSEEPLEAATLSEHLPEKTNFSSRAPGIPRPTLTVARPLADAGVRLWRINAGEKRPTNEILALFAGKRLVSVIIRDPYALATSSTRSAQLEFLEGLRKVASSVDNVTVEYAPEAEGDGDDFAWRRDFGSRFAGSFPPGASRLTLTRRSKRSRDDDFHDRFVDIDVLGAGGAPMRHQISIGRGLEALFNTRRQCTITYVPPTTH